MAATSLSDPRSLQFLIQTLASALAIWSVIATHLPTKFSSTLLLPALCPPTTAIWGRSMPLPAPTCWNASCRRFTIGISSSMMETSISGLPFISLPNPIRATFLRSPVFFSKASGCTACSTWKLKSVVEVENETRKSKSVTKSSCCCHLADQIIDQVTIKMNLSLPTLRRGLAAIICIVGYVMDMVRVPTMSKIYDFQFVLLHAWFWWRLTWIWWWRDAAAKGLNFYFFLKCPTDQNDVRQWAGLWAG